MKTNIFLYRVTDDNALAAKVSEAMSVYEEYVKAQGSDGGASNKPEEAKTDDIQA